MMAIAPRGIGWRMMPTVDQDSFSQHECNSNVLTNALLFVEHYLLYEEWTALFVEHGCQVNSGNNSNAFNTWEALSTICLEQSCHSVAGKHTKSFEVAFLHYRLACWEGRQEPGSSAYQQNMFFSRCYQICVLSNPSSVWARPPFTDIQKKMKPCKILEIQRIILAACANKIDIVVPVLLSTHIPTVRSSLFEVFTQPMELLLRLTRGHVLTRCLCSLCSLWVGRSTQQFLAHCKPMARNRKLEKLWIRAIVDARTDNLRPASQQLSLEPK